MWAKSLPLFPLCAIALCTVTIAQTPPATAPTTTTSAPAPLDPKWPDLLSRLAADDFKIRSAAQKQLAQLPYTDRPLLERLAAKAADPEVQASLHNRAQEMELDEALDPAPISIDIKNASFTDTVAALNKAMGTAIPSWPPNNSFGGGRCTLKMTDQPFWNVFAAIAKQMPIGFQNMPDFRFVRHQSDQAILIRARGLAIFPAAITRSTVLDLQQGKDKPPPNPTLAFSYTVVADPRMRIASAADPQLTEVVDDLGNILLSAPADDPHRHIWWNSDRRTWNRYENLKIPDKLGTKIVSAKGFLRVLVPLASQTVDVEEFDKKSGAPVAIGKYSLKFTQLDFKENLIIFQISVTGGEKTGPEETQIPITLNLTDAKNKNVLSYSITGGGLGGSRGGEPVTKPLKLHLTCPTRTEAVTIPFELKDLPLPPE